MVEDDLSRWGTEHSVATPRILYQSFGPEQNRAYLESLTRTVQAAAAACGAVVEISSLPGARLSQKQHRAFHLAAGAALMEQIYASTLRGYDAAIIGNIQDPALYESRQVCRVPVIGMLEAAFAFTRPFGTSLALITTSELTVPLIQERIKVYGEESRLHAIYPVNLGLTSVSEGFADVAIADRLLGEFDVAAGKAVHLGAELVVPASGLLAALLAARRGHAAAWHAQGGVPIVNPIFAAVAMAAAAARLHQAGLAISRRRTYAAPSAEELDVYFSGRGGAASQVGSDTQ